MRRLKGGEISAMARLIEDIAWTLLLLLVPWSLFDRFSPLLYKDNREEDRP